VRGGFASSGKFSRLINGSQSSASENTAALKPKRLNPIKRKQMKEEVRELEEEIRRVETAIAQREASLHTFVSVQETQRLTRELDESRTELRALIAEWEELSQALEAAD